MGFERRVNKKAQEGLSITTILVLVLGIVVVVLLILGLTGGLDFVFGKFKLLPGQDLQSVVESCGTSANLGLAIDYCTFKKVTLNGDDVYVNCEDSRIQTALAPNQQGKILCETTSFNETGECLSLINEKTYKVTVNGKDIGQPTTVQTDSFKAKTTEQSAIDSANMNLCDYCAMKLSGKTCTSLWAPKAS